MYHVPTTTVKRGGGKLFRIVESNLRSNGENQAFWWVKAEVTDPDGKKQVVEETSAVFSTTYRNPMEQEARNQRMFAYLGMDVLTHCVRLAVPPLPWDEWVE